MLALALLPAVAWSKPKHAKKAAASPAAKMPEFPKEPKPQQAARLWQAGTLAQAKGDYRWAIKQFEGCLKAEPANDDCKAGLKDAKQKLGWNPPRKKKKKATPPPETAEGAADPAAGGEDPKREAVKHWNSGIIYFQKGDYGKAKEEWEQCKTLDPSNSDCDTGLKRAGMPGAEAPK